MPRVTNATGLDKVMLKIRSTRGLSVRIAEACGVHRSAVYQWTRVPATQMATVAKVMDLEPQQVRPDLFRTGKSR
jgi:hypothetical protein